MSKTTFQAFRRRGYRVVNLRRCTPAAQGSRPVQMLARITPISR